MSLMQQVNEEIRQVLALVEQSQMEQLCAAILAAPRIFVLGEGRSGLSARGFAMRLMHLGFPVYVVGETTTPAWGEKDLVIAVSGSGSGVHVLADAAGALKAGCVLAAVSSRADSPLAAQAAPVLVIPGAVKGESGSPRKSIQLLSSLFDQCLHITLDVVCLMLSQKTGRDNRQAAARHF